MIQTPYRPNQNDKGSQPDPEPSKNGIAWSLQIFRRRLGDSLETFSVTSSFAGYDSGQRMAVLWLFTVPRGHSSEHVINFPFLCEGISSSPHGLCPGCTEKGPAVLLYELPATPRGLQPAESLLTTEACGCKCGPGLWGEHFHSSF